MNKIVTFALAGAMLLGGGLTGVIGGTMANAASNSPSETWPTDTVRSGGTVQVTSSHHNPAIIGFTPTTSRTYAFYTIGTTDTYGQLFEEAHGYAVSSDDDSGGNGNFRIEHYCYAYHTYYLKAYPYDSHTTATFYVGVRAA